MLRAISSDFYLLCILWIIGGSEASVVCLSQTYPSEIHVITACTVMMSTHGQDRETFDW